MAALFSFLTVLVLLVVVLNNKTVKRGFKVVDSTLDHALNIVDKSGSKVEDLIDLGLNASLRSANKAFLDSLEEDFHQNDPLLNGQMAKDEADAVKQILVWLNK